MMFKQLTFLLMFITSCTIKTDNNNLRDLDFIYNSILENHPGIYNEEDPNFHKNLKNSYAVIKAKIKKSRSSSNSKKAINDFVRSFNDTHLWIRWFDNAIRKQNLISTKFSISELSKDVSWVRIPTFDLTSKQERDFKELIQHISELKSCKYIIFDLRGNQGGNSEYGSQIVDTLFGKEYANQKRCLYNKYVYVDWRASRDNLAYISSLLTRYPSNHWLQNVENGLQKSLQQGKIFYRELSSEVCTSQKDTVFVQKLGLKVIIITESVNVSAALDFIDELKIMTKNVILIGQKTKADRLYMEVRSVNLPSETGQFIFPIKVYRNRMRGDNKPYIHNIEFADIHNTAFLQSIILKKIKSKKL